MFIKNLIITGYKNYGKNVSNRFVIIILLGSIYHKKVILIILIVIGKQFESKYISCKFNVSKHDHK